MQLQQCALFQSLCEQFNSLKWQQTNPAKNCKGLCYFNKLNHPTERFSKSQGWENGKGGTAQLAAYSNNFPIFSFYVYTLGK